MTIVSRKSVMLPVSHCHSLTSGKKKDISNVKLNQIMTFVFPKRSSFYTVKYSGHYSFVWLSVVYDNTRTNGLVYCMQQNVARLDSPNSTLLF